MFESSLTDLVTGLRNAQHESAFVNDAIRDIRLEIKQSNPDIKAQALEKVIYLHMIGYDMQWAAFHVVEVMSQQWFGGRKFGYIGAAQVFTPETDVLVLTTHTFKKVFTQSSTATVGDIVEISAAMSCLAKVANEHLSMVLLDDIHGLMNSSNDYLRKKAVLVIFSLIEANPPGIRTVFPRLKQRLQDSDPAVVVAAVTTICELSKRNPKNCVSLVPILYEIFTNSTNNWLTIKVIKIFGYIMDSEPRLATKLYPKLIDIIINSNAKSLLFECIQTMLLGVKHLEDINAKHVVNVCVDRLGSEFLSSRDANLKYCGLLGFQRLLITHPNVIADHRSMLLSCLSDADVTIRTRALEIILGVINTMNLAGIAVVLIDGLPDSMIESTDLLVEEIPFGTLLISKLLDLICIEKYALVADFKWYIEFLSVLVLQERLRGYLTTALSDEIARQLLDLFLRLPEFADLFSKVCGKILTASIGIVPERIRCICAWIVGESRRFFTKEQSQALIQALLDVKSVLKLSDDIQGIYLFSAYKLYEVLDKVSEQEQNTEHDQSVDTSIESSIITSLSVLSASLSFEVRERANIIVRLITDPLTEGTIFHGPPLNLISSKVQRKIEIPKDLDLDTWIHEPPTLPIDPDEDIEKSIFTQVPSSVLTSQPVDISKSQEHAEAIKQKRMQDPYYLVEKKKVDDLFNGITTNTTTSLPEPQSIDFMTSNTTTVINRSSLVGGDDDDEPERKQSTSRKLSGLGNIDLSDIAEESYTTAKNQSFVPFNPVVSTPAFIQPQPLFLAGDNVIVVKYIAIPSSTIGTFSLGFVIQFKGSDEVKLKSLVLEFQAESEFFGVAEKSVILLEKIKKTGIYNTTVPVVVKKLPDRFPLSLPVALSYVLKSSKAPKSFGSNTLQLSALSCVVPSIKAPEQLRAILNNYHMIHRTSPPIPFKMNTLVTAFAEHLGNKGNLALVKSVEKGASFYGQSISDTHFAVMLKISGPIGGEAATIEIKSNGSEQFIEAYLADLIKGL